jgi:hypothetical protein
MSHPKFLVPTAHYAPLAQPFVIASLSLGAAQHQPS